MKRLSYDLILKLAADRGDYFLIRMLQSKEDEIKNQKNIAILK